MLNSFYDIYYTYLYDNFVVSFHIYVFVFIVFVCVYMCKEQDKYIGKK